MAELQTHSFSGKLTDNTVESVVTAGKCENIVSLQTKVQSVTVTFP